MANVRTYANSYLYTKIPDYERNILEFVMKAERINKSSEAFSGIIEDVKRRQTTAVLSRVLARDDVVLCMNSKPLPAAFKVFAAKDVKTDKKVKIFIDLSGLITLKNGFFVINKIDIFCSYLMSAMTCVVYYNEPGRLTNNSALITSGTECFVALASHIFDYLRVAGYSENQNKIGYILAMYYQVTVLGLNRSDNSVRNLAAKASGLDSKNINVMEFLYDDKDLTNIDTLITALAKTFKMSIGVDVFVEKWTWYYGVGTHFGTELFTAFATMLTDTYCGAYVNNQKTIEKFCGRSMVDFSVALIRTCSDILDRGFKYESSLDRGVDNLHMTAIREDMNNINLKKYSALRKGEIQDSEIASKKFDAALSITHNVREASKVAKDYMSVALSEANEFIDSKESGYTDFVSETADLVRDRLSARDTEVVSEALNDKIRYCSKLLDEKDNAVIYHVKSDLKEAVDILNGVESLDEADESGDQKDLKGMQKRSALKDLKDEWKKATSGFVQSRWVTRYLNESDKNKVLKYYEAMKKDDISYADYKRYFKEICNFMRIPSDKVIIETIEVRKDNTDKDQDVVAMRYSKGSAKVKIPDGIRLIHVSPVDNITELKPSFRSKLAGKFLYPTKRVYFTVAKEIKSTKAGLEKTKTHRYTPAQKIDYAYIDPACADANQRAVFVETNKPIPVIRFETMMDKIFGKFKKGDKTEDESK